MCTAVYSNEVWMTKNGVIVYTSKSSENNGEAIGCVVIGHNGGASERTKATYPVGTTFTFMNAMGHVLCGGNDEDHQHECMLHELDAMCELSRSSWDEEVNNIENIEKKPAGDLTELRIKSLREQAHIKEKQAQELYEQAEAIAQRQEETTAA